MAPDSDKPTPLPGSSLPERFTRSPASRLAAPVARFLEIEAASGILLILCTAAALFAANSSWAESWDHFWHTKISLAIGEWKLALSLAHWVNDGLMTVFFFVVGLEIKREMLEGELRSLRRAALPIVGAIGGMVLPATIFLLLERSPTGQRGWGIPMATDIAFAVGILALLGKRVPPGLKVFLLALAIADDLGAILVIAIFYSSNVALWPLVLAGGGLVVVSVFSRLGVRSIGVYTLLGAAIWLAMIHSGIHPTVAGVALGLMTPGRAWIERPSLVEWMLSALDRLDGEVERQHVHERHRLLARLTRVANEAISPLERLETALHPWVAFIVMPIFALANAGVAIQPQAAGHRVALAVAAGLLIGKPLGIVLFSWLAVTLRLAQLPAQVGWRSMLGAGLLGGIGFTMSLFIASLALSGVELSAAKIGTLGGSALSGLLGLVVLWAVLPAERRARLE